jgi:hypothetical protein
MISHVGDVTNVVYGSPKHDLGASSGGLTHTWISLTYTAKTGLYMTMYYTPKLPEFWFRPE